jgi:alpha-beta hydrolase superfamily lysophospholipase
MAVEELQGRRGRITYRVWEAPDPKRIVVFAHGYGEHVGRYEHVAEAVVERGAVVYGPDHMGHGRSRGSGSRSSTSTRSSPTCTPWWARRATATPTAPWCCSATRWAG